MYKFVLSFLLTMAWSMSLHANPIKGLLERIDPGCSSKFLIEQKASDTDFFELDQKGDKVVIRGNNYVSIATGVNWYLKYYVGVHLSWNGMTADLPEVLPKVSQKERHETNLAYRYDLNYCTHGYSLAFWDWKRWEQEIDWMALHGINLPLAITGTECVWYNVLKKLGYGPKEIGEYVAGPAFLPWWLMNNMEGWGGPNPDSWYEQQTRLQQKIVKRMREYGIEPVFPGYSGMVPHNAKEKLGLNVSDPGKWCALRRPAFLQPTDPRFEEIASLYYEEMNRLFGKANYYSMDPFHEGGNTSGVDLGKAGQAIMREMKKNNPTAKWVIMAWLENPRSALIKALDKGELLVLDLYSETTPQWGDPEFKGGRKEGFDGHDWLYCMILNFGGNVGMYGKMDQVINSFYRAKQHPIFGKTLKGIGMTPEGIENNSVMFELLSELPWRTEKFRKEEWVTTYVKARYGVDNEKLNEAWHILSNSIYNETTTTRHDGERESLFCARPSLDAQQASNYGNLHDYYNPEDIFKAACLMVSVADQFKGNNNFEYDLVDVVRQAVAEKGRLVLGAIKASHQAGEKLVCQQLSKRFLDLILLQDELLSTRPEFKLGRWIDMARRKGYTKEEKDLYEWNARVQITTWGDRNVAGGGTLHDYAHREWSGLLRDVYYKRWKTFFDSGMEPKIDYYALDEAWTKQTNPYSLSSSDECVEVVKKIFDIVFCD